MEITLEKIELVKDRTGVTYKEAKEALEKTDGNVVEAIIAIEDSVDETNSTRKIGAQGEALIDKMKEIVRRGNIAKIVVKRNGEKLLNIPVNAGVLGAVVAPWGVILGVVAAFGFKCEIELVKDSGEIISLTDKAGNIVEDVKTKGTDIYSDIKSKAPSFYESVREKGEDAVNRAKGAARDARDAADDFADDIEERVDDLQAKADEALRRAYDHEDAAAAAEEEADAAVEAAEEALEKAEEMSDQADEAAAEAEAMAEEAEKKAEEAEAAAESEDEE